jgi:hypothetical protein
VTLVHRDASLCEASQRMRQCRTSELLVVAEDGGRVVPIGTLTASDIVTRVVAVGLDPAVLTAGDIACFARAH